MKTFSATDVGRKRELNQDYIFSSETPVGNLPNLFIVADGMGGHNAGDFASSFTTDCIVREIISSDMENPIKIIRNAIEKANLALMEKASEDPDKSGMGTTVVVATIVDDCLYVANVGDSRLYLVSDDIVQITRDHSLVEEMVLKGELDRNEARNHPDKNIITRAVGATADIKVDFFDMKLREGDEILMCTDGLSNMVEDRDILNIMERESDVAGQARSLIDAANNNGGKDNIAVIVVKPFS
ncbi:Stp1/IreP family PP2C-type Ser/Thr phosphatase [Lachnospiraceae bacterium C1.1]|nr:Stp1/IreP family PP2C-type Ser/Thr phosphatase [Lachnospiraceae bacterium C1.1]